MTHLWERRHKKENTELSTVGSSFFTHKVLTASLTFPPASIDFFPSPFHFSLKNGSAPALRFLIPATPRFFISFLFFFLRHRQKKLNASKTGVAEGQIETNKRCLEYCVKLNFQFLHHFCLVSIIFLPFLLFSFFPLRFHLPLVQECVASQRETSELSGRFFVQTVS